MKLKTLIGFVCIGIVAAYLGGTVLGFRDSPAGLQQMLERSYMSVRLEGFAFGGAKGCFRGTWYMTKFRAVNKAGQPVSGVVCGRDKVVKN